MAKVAASRKVQCYLCRHRFDVSSRAQSTSCPGCHKAIIVEDFVLKRNKPSLLMVTKVQTCGRIVVPRRTRLVANIVVAHQGLEVEGQLEARRVFSGGPVVIGRRALWRGNLNAPSVTVDEAVVGVHGYFEIPGDDMLGLADLQASSTGVQRRPPHVPVAPAARSRN